MLQNGSGVSPQLPSPMHGGSSDPAFAMLHNTDSSNTERMSALPDGATLRAPPAGAHPLQLPMLPHPAPTEITARAPSSRGAIPAQAPRSCSTEMCPVVSTGNAVGYSKHAEIQRVDSSQLQRQQSQANETWKSSSWVTYDKISRQHEFAVEVVSGSAQSCFKFTKIVHIKDKYIIENRTGEVLDVRAPLWTLLACVLASV